MFRPTAPSFADLPVEANQAQQLLRACCPQAQNSISRKTWFAEWIQVDLGCPVPLEKYFVSQANQNTFRTRAVPHS
jgi:hypothetical protein